MKEILHKIAHLFNLQQGICDAYYEENKLMMSFKCTTCGKRDGIHECGNIIDKIIESNKSKFVYIIKRKSDNGFGKPEMYLSLEGAIENVERQQKFYRESITPSQGRVWEDEYYLAKCEIKEIEILFKKII